MPEPLVVVDTSTILEGKLAEVRAVLDELVAFVEANETDIRAYGIYFDDGGSTMTVVQVHPDAASMELHMKLAGPVFRKFTGLLRLTRVDFYGTPSAALLTQMQEKARLLGGADVVVNDLQAGFFRAGSARVTSITGGGARAPTG
jgi:hypothetical protein